MPKANRVHSTPPTNTAIAAIEWLRREAEAEIERLIAFLDETDGFTMDEREADPADDEPSLGWTRAGALGDHRDLEINEVAA